MEKTQQNGRIMIDKYYPQHPLPKEIQDLPDKETVCEFCGISYLIHSEIKRLEEEIISLNKRIKHFEEIEINERKYEEKYKLLNKDFEQNCLKYSSLEEKFENMKTERDSLQTFLLERDDRILKLDSSLKIIEEKNIQLISKQRKMFEDLFKLKRNNEQFHDYYLNIRTEVIRILCNNRKQTELESIKIQGIVDQITEIYESNKQQNETEIINLKSEVFNLSQTINEKSIELSHESEKLKHLNDKNNNLITETVSLQHQINDANLTISQKDEIIRLINKELETMKVDKRAGINTLSDQITLLRAENEKLAEEINKEKNSRETVKLEMESTTLKLQNASTTILELSNLKNAYEAETEKYKEILKTIEECRETTKREYENENLLLKEELSKLQSELKLLEKSETDVKFKLETSMEQQKLYKKEIANLNKATVELQTTKAALTAKEIENNKLQISLTQIINDKTVLLNKLEEKENIKHKTDNEDFEEKIKNQKIIDNLEAEIEDKEKIIDKMEEDIIKMNNEITSLKLMVQKECEERYELTESLNRAREQLLMIGEFGMTKNPTSLPPLPQRNSTSSTSSVKTNTSHSSQKSSVRDGPHNQISHRKFSNNSVISTKRKLESLFNE